MSTTTVPPPPTPSPSNVPDLRADSCISLASILRCYYTSSTEIHHTLLIIPVALQVIFSTALIFTNWGAGRRHLLLVAEGWVIFLLSLIEVLAFDIPAVRGNVPTFRSIDQSIGALSFIQLVFYMSFLYTWVRGVCFPIVPSRLKRIARPLLLIFIPAVIAMNTVASFVGVGYEKLDGAKHVQVHFRDERQAHFVWLFFSSLTIALYTVFQAACFCFAFYRLLRAVFLQRKIEVGSKDAAVLFRGIGWINIGIKVGAIETLVGFVFFGIPIAYVRRVLRLLSRAFICIGAAKGADGTEDFKAFRDELESVGSSGKNFRRSRLRQLISNPRLSTFRQLSPTATAFHATPRAPAINYDLLSSAKNEKPHPYAASAFLTSDRVQSAAYRNSIYARSPIYSEKSALPSPASLSRGFSTSSKPTINNGLPGMSEFAEVKAKRMSHYSPKRVTVYYHHGTPTLHLRLSHLEMPTPAVVAQSLRSRPDDGYTSEYRNSFSQTPRSQFKGRSRFSMTSQEWSIVDDGASVYPTSTMHGHTETDHVYRQGPNPYGYITSSPSTRADDLSPNTFGGGHTPLPSTVAHGHSPGPISQELPPPMPAYLDTPTSQTSEMSAAQAEIIDTPRRKLSFSKQKSALARAVLYPVPPTRVAMALSETLEEKSPPSRTPSRRLKKPRPSPSQSTSITYPSLPSSQRPSSRSPSPQVQPARQSSPITFPEPTPRLGQQQEHRQQSFARESIIDDDGNVITVTAIAPSIDEEEYDSDGKPLRSSTRALSGYSVGSVPETLQAVRELAKKFPGLPPGAVVGDIGLRASTMTPVKERDEADSINVSGDGHDEIVNDSADRATRFTGVSTDTEEIIRKRIPAEVKMKGKMVTEAPPIPLPPVPQPLTAMQQLPPSVPPRNPQRLQRSIPGPPPAAPQPEAQFAAKPIDPFEDDDTTSYRGTASELSPLSMSIKLRHPQSLISNIYPSTQRNSAVTTALTSPVTPFSMAYYQNPSLVPSRLSHARSQSQEGTMSPGVLDFGTTLKEWNDEAGQKIPGIRPMSNLPSIEMVEGHRRNLSAQTRAEFDRQTQRRPRRPDSQASYDIDVSELPDQLQQLRQATSPNGTPQNRIRNIGKAPRRTTPQPTRGHFVRGSTHLQPLVIPTTTLGKDVPISAVGEQVDVEAGMSATTEGASGHGRNIKALSIEDGFSVPIRLQGRKGSF